LLHVRHIDELTLLQVKQLEGQLTQAD